MRTIERKWFRFQRQSEDAEEIAVLITHVEPEPWTCEPCGSTNNEGARLNCVFCGKVRR